MADTRSIQQDELHKRSIATQIKDVFDSITAVLLLADGTVPRVTVGTKCAVSTLSTIFPKTLANNIAFLLTRTSNPLFQNFSSDTLPESFKDAPQFLLNNPIALQRRYLELKDASTTMGRGRFFREAVKASEQDTLEMLVDLFEWLDGLEPQPTSEVVAHYDKLQDIVAGVTGRLANFLRRVTEKVSGRSG